MPLRCNTGAGKVGTAGRYCLTQLGSLSNRAISKVGCATSEGTEFSGDIPG